MIYLTLEEESNKNVGYLASHVSRKLVGLQMCELTR